MLESSSSGESSQNRGRHLRSLPVLLAVPLPLLLRRGYPPDRMHGRFLQYCGLPWPPYHAVLSSLPQFAHGPPAMGGIDVVFDECRQFNGRFECFLICNQVRTIRSGIYTNAYKTCYICSNRSCSFGAVILSIIIVP